MDLQLILSHMQVKREKIARGKTEGGFSLVELLMVIVIIGILSAIAIGALMNQQKATAEGRAEPSDATQQPAPAPSPAPPSEPVDTSWIIPTIGVIGIVIVSLIAVGVLFFLVKKIASNALQGAEELKKIQSAWKSALAQHDSVINDWLNWTKNDIGLILDFPVLQDTKDATTRSVVEALDRARALRPESAVKRTSPDDYSLAVQKLATAWEEAKTYARKVKQSCLTEKEQKDIRLAQSLLATIQHENTPRAEKILAAQRVQKLLEGFVELGDKPRLELESIVQLSLTSGGEVKVSFDSIKSPEREEPLHVVARKSQT